MGPIGHTVVSLGMGAAVWSVTGSPLAIPVAFAAGVLPDLDHLVDFFDPKEDGRHRFMLRPFHGWELFLAFLIVVLAFYSEVLFFAALLGYLSHLVIDQLTNRVHPLAYSIIFRAFKGFRRRHLTPRIFEPSYLVEKDSMPLWARIEPSVWRWVTRLRSEER